MNRIELAGSKLKGILPPPEKLLNDRKHGFCQDTRKPQASIQNCKAAFLRIRYGD